MPVTNLPYDRRLNGRAKELRHENRKNESSGMCFCGITLLKFTSSASLSFLL